MSKRVTQDELKAFVTAASGADAERVRQCIAAGYDVTRMPRELDRNALTAAAGNGHLEIVEMLLAGGASATEEKRGNFPLQASFDAWLKHPDGRTPYRAVLLALIKAGAAPTEGMLSHIVHYDLDHELLRTLFDAARRLPWHENFLKRGGTLYLSAAMGDISLEMLRTAITAGANVNAWSALRGTPLITAIGFKHENVVRELIEAKADVNLATQRGETPLLAAIKAGSVTIVEMLLAAGALVNERGNLLLGEAQDLEGKRALDWAKSAGVEYSIFEF